MPGAIVRYALIAGLIIAVLVMFGSIVQRRETHRPVAVVRRGSFGGRSRRTSHGFRVLELLAAGAVTAFRLAARCYRRVTVDRPKPPRMLAVAVAMAFENRTELNGVVEYGNVLFTASATVEEKLAIEARNSAFISSLKDELQRVENRSAAVHGLIAPTVKLDGLTVQPHVSGDGHAYALWSWGGVAGSRQASEQRRQYIARLRTEAVEDLVTVGTGRRARTAVTADVVDDRSSWPPARYAVSVADDRGTFGTAIAGGAEQRQVVIGRSSSADLVLPGDDTRTSREHVTVAVLGDTAVVTDHSRHGTWLVGADDADHRLTPGVATPLPQRAVLSTSGRSVTITVERLS